jgi:hypothetical protein
VSRFEALGHYVYEDGNRIGCTPEEASAELARKLNAYQMRVERFKAENARIKAEVERLKGIILAQSSEFVRNATKQEEEPLPDGWNSSVAKACDLLAEKDKDYARLKAEVENSKRINTELLVLSNRQASDIRRLTKAGDWLVEAVQTDDCWENWDKGIAKWNAAKNGGQP